MNIYLKRSILSILICLFYASLHSQTHIKLILKTSLPIDSAFIVHYTNKESIRLAYKDTLELHFKTGSMDFYHINYMEKEKIYNAAVFLDSGNLEITGRIENNKLLLEKVTGSPIYDKVSKWKIEYADLVDKKDSLGLDSFLLKTYEEHINNMFSFNIGSKYLNLNQNDRLKLYALLPLIARQSDELKKQFGFQIMNDRLQGIIRNNALDLTSYTLIDLKNRALKSAPLKKGFTILDFWFVGCLPCMEDHEKISKLLPFLKQKNAELISISNDDSYQTWKNYIKKHGYNWLQYKKPPTKENIITQLGITTYPTYLLLNEDGKILFSTYSLEELIKLL